MEHVFIADFYLKLAPQKWNTLDYISKKLYFRQIQPEEIILNPLFNYW